MPRDRKAQPNKVSPGQQYGVQQAQQQAMRQLPLPDDRVQTQQLPQQQPGQQQLPQQQSVPRQQSAPQQQPVPSDPLQAAIMAATAMQGPGSGLLTGPTSFPERPITTGLPIGAGPGPAAMAYYTGESRQQVTLKVARQLADLFDDETIASMVDDR